MTATILLADLCRQGASVSTNANRLRVEAPRGVLTPGIREALATHKADLIRLLAFAEEYRALLRSDIPDPSFLDAQAWLIDDLGPALATAVRRAVECGQPGLRHA